MGRVAESIRMEASSARQVRELGGVLSRSYNVGKAHALAGKDCRPDLAADSDGCAVVEGAYLDGYFDHWGG